MIEHQGVWLPDGEKHLVDWMTKNGEIVDGKGTYQIKKLRAALAYVTSWVFAVDVGAHVGLFSMQLSKRFARVIAFEPVQVYRECFKRNVPPDKYELNDCALGDHVGSVTLVIDPESSGNTHVGEECGPTPMNTLDDLVEVHEPVGFLKIDCEGYEENVIRGGRALITAQRPVILVEQKPHVMERNFGTREPRAVRMLESWGYRVREEISGDFILTA